MTSTSLMQRGIDLTRIAVEADQEGDFHKAHKHYLLGIQAFVGVLRGYNNAAVAKQLRAKVEEYMTRAEQIAAMVHGDTVTNEESAALGFPDAPDALVDEPTQKSVKVAEASGGIVKKTVVRPVPAVADPDDDIPPIPGGDFVSRVIVVHEGDRGHSFDRLFGGLVDGAAQCIRVEDHVRCRRELLAFVRFVECVVVRRGRKPTRIELVTDFSQCSEEERRVSLMALLDLAKEVEVSHGISFVMTREAVDERGVSNDAGEACLLSRGLDIFQDIDDVTLGSGGTQECRKCFAFKAEFAAQTGEC